MTFRGAIQLNLNMMLNIVFISFATALFSDVKLTLLKTPLKILLRFN